MFFSTINEPLFITVSTTWQVEVSCNTVSLWLRAIIIQVYEAALVDPPRASNPHEIWVVTLEDMEGVYSFGPLVVA